jgi:hypothetical protein
MNKHACPDCKTLVKEWNKKCEGCGYKLVLEPEAEARASYLRRPSLGALLWTQGWAFGARTYLWFVVSLVPIVGVAALIILVIFGRRISWSRGGWASWDEFQSRMKMMDVIGVIWILMLVVIYFLARS